MTSPPSDPHGDPPGDSPGDPPADPQKVPPDGIPPAREVDLPADTDPSNRESAEGRVPPLSPLPREDFWAALYGRRSVRRFESKPIPRELVKQVMHAGIWAPSSCNYQMWDLVAVDDPEVNARLGALSTQLANAPVNIVVAYGRDFSRENDAGIQSASALIQNMSLAAGVLGLGSFWITQTGGAEKVRELVGLPHDRMVVAVLALGWPRSAMGKGPRRRPLSEVAHFNHYGGRPIPSSPDPRDWEPDLLAIYQRARVLNGLRHNKPRAWEERALLRALERFVPPAEADGAPIWLDVLPCTGILTARMARERKGYAFQVLERTAEVARFVSERLPGDVPTHLWPGASGMGPAEGSCDQMTCLFRLEGMPPAERGELLAAMARWLKPGGRLLLGFVSSRSFHGSLESVRRRGSGPGGVEYVLSPDPNIGPFQALAPRAVHDLVRAAGLRVKQRLGLQALPQPEELDFRTRNFRPLTQSLARTLGKACLGLEAIPGVQSVWGRFQFLELTR